MSAMTTAVVRPSRAHRTVFNLGSAGAAEFDDVTAFAAFMRFLAPPTSCHFRQHRDEWRQPFSEASAAITVIR